MKPRRRKGATLGLVAVSLLVIIVIGVGCYFLIKLCGGGREVGNSTDAGTLNVAKYALRSSLASAPIPSDATGYQFFAGCADPNLKDASGNPIQAISLFTYNRCVAQALLMAINAVQPDAGPTAVAHANQVFSQLQTIGTTLKNSLNTQNNFADPTNNTDAFSSVASNNSLKMFGNNAIAESAGSYATSFMKPGGSTNVFFSTFSLTSGASTGPGGMSYDLTTAIPGLNSMLINSGTETFTPNASIQGPYNDMGASGGPGGNTAYLGKYMQGYTAITIPGVSGTFVGVPVFPQQRPHLVSLADFASSNPTMTFTDPNNPKFTPPNSFKVATQSKDSKTNNFGGAVACAIVGAVSQNTGFGGPLYGASSPNPDFVAEFPYGYIAISNDPICTQSMGNPNVGSAYAGPQDGTNSIFNWELNPFGTTYPGITLGGTLPDGDTIFYQDTGSQLPSSTLQQWAAYNAAGDPASGTSWTDFQGVTHTTPPPVPPAGGVGGDPHNSAIFVASPNGQTEAPITVAELYTVTSATLSAVSPAAPDNNCKTDLLNTNMGWSSPAGPGDACWANVNAMSAAFNRTSPSGTGPGSTNGSQVYWSNVDEIKAEIAKAFNTPYVAINTPGPAAAPACQSAVASASQKSGLGAYKVPMSGGTVPYMPWYGADSTGIADNSMGAGLSINTTYHDGLPPLEKPSSVMDLVNQVGGCAMNSVMKSMWQRANEIAPGTSYQDLANVLNTTIVGMGTAANSPYTVYIQRQDPTDPKSPLVAKISAPGYSGSMTPPAQADGLNSGTAVQQTAMCDSGAYNLYNGGQGLIDTKSLDGINGADDNLHDQPYTSPINNLTATDHANFVTGSGYQGMLGMLEFYQTTAGTGAFSRPN